ncbi:L-threonate dehydrogenase [Kushneria marisflavi]|uniref:L-threonate dehydrogenase n=1 Tax=Kushneria marisflavi TaxID=157779 RepID=A0A240UST4_9GAMM|nr:L-threonate dehydrogenase [Kushneria marisflavi]ART64544.1 3-hydroxyisobutyrate dehydrogenase [Kushneria marisflavi]RKD87164.1 3-hydroxyisobutyrate dehydrogenase [Kushneria marisflavi]
MAHRLRAGVIGLGSMGMGMASSLIRGGFDTQGCDINAGALERLAAEGGRPVANPAEMGRQVDIVFLVVVNAAQMREVLLGSHGLASTLSSGSIVVGCATAAPDDVIALAAELKEKGIDYLDIPISGGAVKSAAGELTLMASGPSEVFERAQPTLDAIAATIFRLGEAPGQGSQVKLVNQLLAGVHIAAAAEAMAYGIKSGCDPQTLYEVITKSAGNSWMFENRVPHILDGDYTPRSAVDIFVKDLGLVHDTARAGRFPLPMTAQALTMFSQASSMGFGREDDAGVVRIFPGIDLPTQAAND